MGREELGGQGALCALGSACGSPWHLPAGKRDPGQPPSTGSGILPKPSGSEGWGKSWPVEETQLPAGGIPAQLPIHGSTDLPPAWALPPGHPRALLAMTAPLGAGRGPSRDPGAPGMTPQLLGTVTSLGFCDSHQSLPPVVWGSEPTSWTTWSILSPEQSWEGPVNAYSVFPPPHTVKSRFVCPEDSGGDSLCHINLKMFLRLFGAGCAG